MRRVVFTLVSALCANVAIAAPLTQSLRPVARPVAIEPELSQPDLQSGPAQSLRPKLRPPHIEKALAKRAALLAKGAVCGDIAIQGETIGRVSAKRSGCGVNDAVKVSSISGVALSQKSIMDCKTASALKKWIDDGAKKVIGTQGGGLASLQIMGHYSCRNRNNQKGGKISEHGRGRAVDIGAFKLKNGTSFSVLRDWNGSKWSDELSKMHRAACGPFGTVLGPHANKYHKDHFHFDTARYRSGSYCK